MVLLKKQVEYTRPVIANLLVTANLLNLGDLQ